RVPGEPALNVESGEPSSQWTSTAQGPSAPGSLNEPRPNGRAVPSLAPWSPGGVTAGGTLLTVIVNVCGAPVSLPPLAVPPSSCRRTVTTALPTAPAAGV